MARRRVQDEGAQGELAAANGSIEASAALHAQSAATAERIHTDEAIRAAHVPEPKVRTGGLLTDTRYPAPTASPASPETITVTWGEELFTPVQFCSFRVGPYSAMTTLRVGESREQAGDRLMRELEKIASKERDIKIRVYREGLEKVIPGKARS